MNTQILMVAMEPVRPQSIECTMVFIHLLQLFVVNGTSGCRADASYMTAGCRGCGVTVHYDS